MCSVWSAECGLYGVGLYGVCEVLSMECVERVECGVRGVWNAEYGV